MEDKCDFYEKYGAEEYDVIYPEFPSHAEGWRRENGPFVRIAEISGTSARGSVSGSCWTPANSRCSVRTAEELRLKAEQQRRRAEEEAKRAEEQRQRADRLAARLLERGVDPNEA